jgi:hypothetical protein
MGRPRNPNPKFYLGWYRIQPGDPPELAELLGRITAMGREKDSQRNRVLGAALRGGLGQAQAQANAEDVETSAALDDLMAGF